MFDRMSACCWAFDDSVKRMTEDVARRAANYVPDRWLGGRDSNPDTQIQSLQSYR